MPWVGESNEVMFLQDRAQGQGMQWVLSNKV